MRTQAIGGIKIDIGLDLNFDERRAVMRLTEMVSCSG
jgi:hypothetical protein